MELNIGVLLELQTRESIVQHLFQNYKIGQTVQSSGTYQFAPFSFSGAVTNLEGDNIEAGLVFPGNKLTKTWAEQALREGWIAKAKIMLLDEDSNLVRMLYGYVGQVSSGGWDLNSVELSLSTVMDATRGTVPARRYIRQLVGRIPITSSINV
jgi:hypothetical protein